jgi:AcrR family transcriptional regulator
MVEQAVTYSRQAEIGRTRREITRAKLIAAAARVVARLGQEKATIDDFIQAAGVSRGTFYNYFPTRDQIVDALWAHVGRTPFLEIHDSCRKIKDPALGLIAETKLITSRAGSDEVWGWLIYSLSGDFETVNEDLLTFPLPMLKEGIATGRFVVRDLDAARDAVVNIVRGGIFAKLIHRSSADYERSVWEMILLALGNDSNEAALVVQQALQPPAAAHSGSERAGR